MALKAAKILSKYGDSRTHPVYGDCCDPNENPQEQVQITRDMASDAGDPSLEGQWINW